MWWVVNATPRPLYPRERPSTHCTTYKKLDGPHGRSGPVRKTSPSPGFDSRTVQPLASHYTDWYVVATHTCQIWTPFYQCLPFILLTWRIGWALNNASGWQMGFNLAFKGLMFDTLQTEHKQLRTYTKNGSLSRSCNITIK